MQRVWVLCAICVFASVAVAGAQTGVRPARSAAASISRHKPSTHPRRAAVLFGHSSVGRDNKRIPTAGAGAFRFRSNTVGSARALTLYVDSDSRARILSVGLYSDRRGHPGSLLTSGSRRLRRVGVWVSVMVQPVATSRAFYWIAVRGRGGALFVRIGAGKRCKGKSTYARHVTMLPARWAKGPLSTACPMSAYVTGSRLSAGTTPVGGGTGGGTGTGTGNVNLPPGVTLRQIDGGPDYYCSSGLTYACNGGWDKPSFFPILDDYAFYPSHSMATFDDLSLNTSVRVTSDTNLSYLRSGNVWAILNPGSGGGTNIGSESIGWHIEEPSTWSDITSQAGSAGSGVNGRFLQPSFTWNQLYYDTVSGTPCGDGSMQYVMSCTTGMPGGRHLDIPTDDVYWFAASGTAFGQQYPGALIYNNGTPASADQMARGSNYGDMVDTMRSWLTKYPAPGAPYIETEDGLVNGGREITPPELNWAVWSTIVHGARLIIYFGTTSSFGSGPTFGFSQSVLPGQSTSMYKQAKSTNTRVHDLAPVINSPFALNYASVTPAAYTFPTPHRVWDTGIDVMTKYYSGGDYTTSAGTFSNGFYIFAAPRGSETWTNIPATFALAGNYSGTIPVTCACSPGPTTGTVSVNNHQITDTFAHASDVHIYGPIPNQ